MRSHRGPAVEWIVHHEDGIPWHDAPAPPKRHKHVTQTTGTGPTGLLQVDRCACGAFRSYDASGLSDWYYLDPPRVAPRRTIRNLFRRK